MTSTQVRDMIRDQYLDRFVEFERQRELTGAMPFVLGWFESVIEAIAEDADSPAKVRYHVERARGIRDAFEAARAVWYAEHGVVRETLPQQGVETAENSGPDRVTAVTS